MQSGMLFQALLDSNGNSPGGFDIEQLDLTFGEELDPSVLEAAWNLVTRRHPTLATSFQWDGLDEPRQAINRYVTIPLSVERWAHLDDAEQRSRIVRFLRRDRCRGFDLRIAPLMRVTMFCLGKARTELVWSFHHALLDGRSLSTVLREVFLAYDAIASGHALEFPAAPLPYSDFIAWLGTLDQKASKTFFHELLAGKSAPTPLPNAEPALHPLSANGYGEAIHLISESDVLAARRVAIRTNTSLGTVLQAAWALVLSRFTGDMDVVFGASRACRRTALDGNATSMIGLFTNTLPIRARFGSDGTVADLLMDIRGQSLAMRNHEHTSLASIRQQTEYADVGPPFETLLMFESHGLCQDLLESAAPHWTNCQLTLHEQPALPLTLTIYDGTQFEVRAVYDRRRFKSSAVDRLLAALNVALCALSKEEHLRVSELDVLPFAERRRILFDWNDTSRPFPDKSCIQEPFEAQVGRTPEALAVEMDGAGLSYLELEKRANRLAHALRSRGARPGVYIGIALSRGLDLVVALLGVAKSGAAYVPLDPQYPQALLAFMLADALVPFIITEDKFRDLCDVPTLILDAEGALEVARMPAERPVRWGTSTDVCYAIFTSGSTGAPKGVVLSHRAVVNTCDWVTRTFGLGPGDRLLFVTSPCFDLSVYDTFGVLGAGGTVVIASSELLQDPSALATAVIEARITVWNSAPVALQQLVLHFPNVAHDSALRLVLLSGDWIPVSLPSAVHAAFPHAKVISLGGATEAAIWSNWFPVDTVNPRWSSIPYGKPIQNSRYYVLDARLHPVPIGTAGDLYIGGTCLANGYLAREALTRERFIGDPFVSEERLYKTGDIARYFEDGNLEFLGRADSQVKVRGFRVELGEVEAVLRGIPGVIEAICVARDDASDQKSLVAYVVLETGAILTEETLRANVANKTPQFMVPSRVIQLSAFPLSRNGKLDRNALPPPATQTHVVAPLVPRSELEQRMVELWLEVLQRQSVGVSEDFYQLGGHSLLAILLVSRIKSQLGMDLPLSRMMKQPTIESLVAFLEANSEASAVRSYLVTFNGTGSRPPLFLFPGAGGNSFIYRGLPLLLGDDQPVYAFEAITSATDSNSVDLTIEEMATIYVQEILMVRPPEQFVLAGYSFGILVAFEVARQLRACGRCVPLLISLDGFAPGFPRRMPLPASLERHIRALLEADTPGRIEYLRERVHNVRQRALKWLGRAEERLRDLPVAEMDLTEHRRRLWAQLWQTRNRYSPKHVEPCNLLLVKAEVQQRWIGNQAADKLYGWSHFVSGAVDTVTIPGRHLTLFDGNNQHFIAQAIEASITPYTVCHVGSESHAEEAP